MIDLIPYIILAVAFVIVAMVALHAMNGVRDNRDAIKHLERRADRRWQSQNEVNNAAAMDIGRLKARLDVVEVRTTDDGK